MIKTCQVEAEESRALRARLPSTLVSAAEGRQRVRDAIDGWQIPISPGTAQDVVLVASEPLADAVRVQPGATITLCTSIHADRLRIAVHDASPGAVVGQAPRPAALNEDSRGLVIVAVLARCWGWHPMPGGKPFTPYPRPEEIAQ
jgi:hypothetical protein